MQPMATSDEPHTKLDWVDRPSLRHRTDTAIRFWRARFGQRGAEKGALLGNALYQLVACCKHVQGVQKIRSVRRLGFQQKAQRQTPSKTTHVHVQLVSCSWVAHMYPRMKHPCHHCAHQGIYCSFNITVQYPLVFPRVEQEV